LVDGHSAIFAIDELRELHRGASRHLARLELVKWLRDFGDRSEWKVVVVFDGTGPERTSEGGAAEGLLVIYASRAETADAVVERLAARFADKGDEVRVASDDGMVRTTALAFGASAMRIGELEQWMAFELD